MTNPRAKSFPVQLPPVLGHRSVTAKRHWLGVLCAVLAAGAFGAIGAFGLFTYLHVYTRGAVGLDDGFWVGWFTGVVVAFVAAPLIAIVFTLARAVLNRIRVNLGLVYVVLGMAIGLLFARAGVPNRLQSLWAELAGMAAGLTYWAVATRGLEPQAVTLDQNLDVIAADEI